MGTHDYLADRNRQQQGEKQPNAKLKDQQAREMREYRKAGWSIPDLARWFRVAPPTVSAIIHGRSYRTAGGPVEPVGSRKFTRSVIS